ncbi:rhomboid family intramembrane serine protease [Pollutibacter soli]|uniref:rhomboid family intramembrane serine protease n=1 Tax=Pollutibacter soli TaxID=3034157 RepID=UPI003013B36B
MGQRDYPRVKRSNIWSDNNALMMLIILNVIVFVLLHMIKTIYGLSFMKEEAFMKNTYSWFTMPADPQKFFQRPWTILTAQFAELKTMLLLSNLFWLWTFGYILQDLVGNRKIVPLYLYGGIAGGIIFLLSFNSLPQLKSLADTEVYNGAITSVIAIAIATTVISPNYRLFPMISGGIPLWIISIIFVVVDFAWISRQPGLFFPHIASAAVGFSFAKALQRGIDWGAWMGNLYDRFMNLFNPEKKNIKRNPVKQEVFYNTRGQKPFKKTANLTQQKIDEILDKINQKGYDRLTEEEKDLLKRASEEDL